MDDIYKYNSDFDNEKVIDKLNDIAEAIEQEEDSEKRFQLVYAQFIQGLKLSTNNNWF